MSRPLVGLRASTSPALFFFFFFLGHLFFLFIYDHIQHIRTDISRKLGAFCRGRNSLDNKARKAFYLSIIQSKLEYASNAYAHSLSQTNYNILMSISRSALRITFGYPSRADISSILLAHHITCLADRLNLKLFMFTYRCLHNLCSPLLAGIFDTRIDSSHTAACTRSQATFGLALPKVFSRYGYYSLSFLAADRFNSVPVDIRSAQSAAEFRAKCLSHIIGCPVTRPA